MIFEILASIGLMWILKHGSILDPLRRRIVKIHPKVDELFKCSMCLGFWSGACVALFSYSLNENQEVILLPLAASGLSWLLDSLLDLIQISCNKLEGK